MDRENQELLVEVSRLKEVRVSGQWMRDGYCIQWMNIMDGG